MKLASGVVVLGMLVSARAEAARLLAVDDVHGCAFTGQGQVVAATEGGLVLEGRAVLTALEGLPDTRVTAVAVREDDTIVLETPRGLATVDPSNMHIARIPGPVAPLPAPATLEMHEGGVVHQRVQRGPNACVATSAGLFLGRAGSAPVRTELARDAFALPTGDVSALTSTPQGLFVGTFDRGVYVFDGAGVRTVPVHNANVNALAWDEASQALWVATARGLERCAGDAPCRRVGDAEPMHALAIGPDAVVAGGEGRLSFFDHEGRATGRLDKKSGAPFRSVWALATSREGVLFVGTTSGIYSGTAQQFVEAPSTLQRAAMVNRALPDDWVTSLAFQGSALVAGTYNAGIATFAVDGARLTFEREDRSLGYVNIDGLRVLPDGRLAVATMDGLRLGRIGQFLKVPTLGEDVTAVATVSNGNGWIATRRGVSALSLAASGI